MNVRATSEALQEWRGPVVVGGAPCTLHKRVPGGYEVLEPFSSDGLVGTHGTPSRSIVRDADRIRLDPERPEVIDLLLRRIGDRVGLSTLLCPLLEVVRPDGDAIRRVLLTDYQGREVAWGFGGRPLPGLERMEGLPESKAIPLIVGLLWQVTERTGGAP